MTEFEEVFVVSEIDPFGNVPGVSSLGCESLTSQNLCVIDVPTSMISINKGDRLKVHMQTIQTDASTNYLKSNSEGSDLAVRGLILNIKNDNGRVLVSTDICLQASVCGMDLVLEVNEKCAKRFSIHDEILLCIKKL